jgi:hypothetical protein
MTANNKLYSKVSLGRVNSKSSILSIYSTTPAEYTESDYRHILQLPRVLCSSLYTTSGSGLVCIYNLPGSSSALLFVAQALNNNNNTYILDRIDYTIYYNNCRSTQANTSPYDAILHIDSPYTLHITYTVYIQTLTRSRPRCV